MNDPEFPILEIFKNCNTEWWGVGVIGGGDGEIIQWYFRIDRIQETRCPLFSLENF